MKVSENTPPENESFEERMKWVESHFPKARRSARLPIEDGQQITEALLNLARSQP